MEKNSDLWKKKFPQKMEKSYINELRRFLWKKFLPQIFEIPTYQLRMNKLRCGNRLSIGKASSAQGSSHATNIRAHTRVRPKSGIERF